eukprot:gene6417-3038_t
MVVLAGGRGMFEPGWFEPKAAIDNDRRPTNLQFDHDGTLHDSDSGFGVLNQGLQQHPGSSIRATTPARVYQANTKVKQSQTKPACKPQGQHVKVHATSENVDQDKAVTNQSQAPCESLQAAHIPKEERAAELEAIHKELVTDLGMEQEVASKVLKAASPALKSVLSRENCRGWIVTLRKLGLDDRGVIKGLQMCPIIPACSAGGREEHNIEAYQDMGRERYPTTIRLEEAIVVCQDRWDSEWKAKFDERSLMMQAEWKVSGITGLPTIEDHMGKEE